MEHSQAEARDHVVEKLKAEDNGIRTVLKDPRLVAIVLLGGTLGLRFREAALFDPSKNWGGNRIVIREPSW